MVHDLYEGLQSRLPREGAHLALEPLLTKPVPLLRGDRIAYAMLKDALPIYVDDDPVRRMFIDDLDQCYVLPKRSTQSYSELVPALEGLLGNDSIRRVSESPVDIDFEPAGQGVRLLEMVREAFPTDDVAEDMGLLIVKGGAQATSPHEERFRRYWNDIARTRVIGGAFRAGMLHASCFDAQYEGGPALLVRRGLQPQYVVREMWQAVGPSYRDIWAAYADALREGRTSEFFAERAVSVNDRTEVKSAIGLGFEHRLRRYQPVCLAKWRSIAKSRPIDEFHHAWRQQAQSAKLAEHGCHGLTLGEPLTAPSKRLNRLDLYPFSGWRD